MRKLAWFAISFGAAVFARVYLLPQKALLPIAAALAALFVLALIIHIKKRPCLRICILTAGLCAALLWCSVYDALVSTPAQKLAGQTLRVIVRVTDWPEETDYGVRVEGRMLQEGGGRFRVLLYLDEEYAVLRPGDEVSTVAKLSDAGVTMGEKSDYYYALGIRLKATGYGGVEVAETEHVSVQFLPQYLAAALKGGMSAALPEEYAAMAHAVVTGDRAGLDDGFYSDLQRCGLAHAVAVSGMHLSFLVGLLNILLRRRRKSAIVSIAVIVLFTLMAGAGPSVMRAAVMQVLLLLAPLLGREYDGVTALSVSLLFLLVQNPYAAASVSLHLSFGAVAGILLISRRLTDWLCKKAKVELKKGHSLKNIRDRLLYFLFGSISVSVGAMLFTLPLTAIHFQSVALLSPLSNLLSLWAVELLFFFGLLGGVAGAFLPAVGSVLALTAIGAGKYLACLVPNLASIPLSSLPMLSFYMAAWLVFVYAILTLNLLWKGRGKCRPFASFILCALALLGAVWLNSMSYASGDMTVSVLDVGQGQSVVIRAGDCYALVDCGGTSLDDPGDVAADFLLSIGRRRLDLLILTHYHSDHANGIPQLMRRVKVDTLLVPDVEPESPLRQEILQMAEEEGVAVRFVREDTMVTVGEGLTIEAYPPLGEGTTNELGLSILATAGTFDALLTGDMSSDVEQLLLQHTVLPDVELLVVGHHGSRYATSEELLSAARPDIAVISVGYNNYGHPTQDVLDRLDAVGALVYRTDQNGTVTIHADDGE